MRTRFAAAREYGVAAVAMGVAADGEALVVHQTIVGLALDGIGVGAVQFANFAGLTDTGFDVQVEAI